MSLFIQCHVKSNTDPVIHFHVASISKTMTETDDYRRFILVLYSDLSNIIWNRCGSLLLP